MKKLLIFMLTLFLAFGQVTAITYADTSNSKMYSVPADGDMEGWQLLKGHIYEAQFEIYYKIEDGKIKYETKDLRNVDLSQVVEWTDIDGQTRESTVAELYELFNTFDNKYTSDWLGNKFGDVYYIWAMSRMDNESALGVIELYLRETKQINKPTSVQLTPDIKPSDYTVVEVDDGTFTFKPYDKNGNALGKYKDEDDGYVVAARIEHKDLPPRLSEGWINIDLLQKIYGYYCTKDNNEIVITASPIGPKPEVVADLKLPDNWLSSGDKEIKVKGIGIQKYTLDQLSPEEQWFSKEDLSRKTGLSVSATGESLYAFAICAYNGEKGITEKLFKAEWPKNWWDKNDQNEITLNGLRIKRKNNVDYFNVEDLGKLNILKSASKDYQIYLNIADLQNASVIK